MVWRFALSFLFLTATAASGKAQAITIEDGLQQQTDNPSTPSFAIGTPEKRVLVKDIGMGIICPIPLVLHLPPEALDAFSPEFKILTEALAAIEPEQKSAEQAATCLAAVIYTWNI